MSRDIRPLPTPPPPPPPPPSGALGRFNSNRILNATSLEKPQPGDVRSMPVGESSRASASAHAHAPHQRTARPKMASLFSFSPPGGDAQKLFKGAKEKERYEDMASIFSILTATERLENMWARRGAIHQQDYEKQCDILIQQYNVLKGPIERTVPSLERFIVDYDMKINFAANRLKAGVPQTVTTGTHSGGKAIGRVAMNCTSSFITITDCIESNLVEVGTLLPYLTTLTFNLDAMKRNAVRNGQDSNIDIREPYEWREKLNEMPAHERLSVEQAKQLKVDIDNAYQAFEHTLND